MKDKVKCIDRNDFDDIKYFAINSFQAQIEDLEKKLEDINDKRDFQKNIEYRMVNEITKVTKKQLDAFRIYNAITFSDYIPKDFCSTFFKPREEEEDL